MFEPSQLRVFAIKFKEHLPCGQVAQQFAFDSKSHKINKDFSLLTHISLRLSGLLRCKTQLNGKCAFHKSLSMMIPIFRWKKFVCYSM